MEIHIDPHTLDRAEERGNCLCFLWKMGEIK